MSSDSGHEHDSDGQRDFKLEDLSEECKALYVLLSRKLDAVIDEVRTRDEKLKKNELENSTLKKKVHELEGRLDVIETQNRSSNLVLSGKTSFCCCQ